MAWFKVDDKFHGSKPVKQIPRAHRAAVIGLWTLAGSWSSDHLQDGYVPSYIVEDLGGDEVLAGWLVTVKLWRKKRDGYQFNEWAKWQVMREAVEARQKYERDRKAAYRDGMRGNTGESTQTVPRDTEQNPPPPVPSRPDPTRPNNSSSKGTSSNRGRGKNDEEQFHNGDKPVDNSRILDRQRVADHLGKLGGRVVSVLEAGVVTDWILDRAKDDPRMPTRYVVASINRDQHEWRKFLETGEPPA